MHDWGVVDNRHRGAALLRNVDGLPHVIIGPVLLWKREPLERWTGVPKKALTAILLPFTAYGIAVVAGTQRLDAPSPRWLLPLAVTANSAAIAAGLAAATHGRLTLLGRLAGGGLAAGGVRVLMALRRPPA